jgi:hypothetical protein
MQPSQTRTPRHLFRRLSLVSTLCATLSLGVLASYALGISAESAGGGPGTMFTPHSASAVYVADSAGGGPGTM